MKIKEAEYIKKIIESCQNKYDEREWRNSCKRVLYMLDKEIALRKERSARIAEYNYSKENSK